MLLRKDGNIITDDTQNIKQVSLSPEELGELIGAAQSSDQQAIDRLCAIFRPLVLKEAHLPSVYNALGEDAENTAWVIFLELIQLYKDKNFRQLPGLFKIYLHFGLLHALHQQGCLLDCEAIDGSEDFAETIAEPRDHLADSEVNIKFRDALKKLSIAQRKVITAVDLHNVDIKTFSKAHKCSYQSSYKTRLLGLKKLRKYFD